MIVPRGLGTPEVCHVLNPPPSAQLQDSGFTLGPKVWITVMSDRCRRLHLIHFTFTKDLMGHSASQKQRHVICKERRTARLCTGYRLHSVVQHVNGVLNIFWANILKVKDFLLLS